MKLQSVFWSLISQQWGVQVECIVQSQYNMNYVLYNTLFSREENFAKSEFEIFSRKYLPAKISSRENILSRK